MRKLIYFIFIFPILLFPIKAHAAVNGFTDFFGNLDTEFNLSANSSRNGAVRFTSNGNFSDNFIYADVCTTGNEPTLWLTNYISGSGQPSTKWYKVNTRCMVNGYEATVYRQIIYITSTSYEEISGYQPLYSFYASGTLFSNTSYTTFMRILHLGVSPTVPLEDIIYSQNETEISVLNDILNQLRNSSSQTQQVIDSNNAIKQQIQEANQKQQETNNKLDNIDDTLNDSSIDSSDDTLNSLNQNLPVNSVISDLLLLPVNMLRNIVNAIDGSCSNFNLGSLYGTNLIMPCINLQSYVGNTIWVFIDLVFCGFFILVIRKKFIEIFQNITNMRGGDNEID